MSLVSSVIRRFSTTWRTRSFRSWVRNQAQDRPLHASGLLAVAPARRPTPLAMLFREHIAAAEARHQAAGLRLRCGRGCRRQCSAEGLYPETIETDVSQARLARFFSKRRSRLPSFARAARGGGVHGTGTCWLIRLAILPPRPGLMSELADLSALEAQAKVISLFHFARCARAVFCSRWAHLGDDRRRQGERFQEVISKPERLFRHIGRSGSGEFGLPRSIGSGIRALARPGLVQIPSRQTALADLCRRLVMEAYAPAAYSLIAAYECLCTLWVRQTGICVCHRGIPPMICWRWRVRTCAPNSALGNPAGPVKDATRESSSLAAK